MKHSIHTYRGRVITALVVIQLWVIYFAILNPHSDLNFWTRHNIGYNDFLWYIIGFLTLISVFAIAYFIDKALFYGLDEND